MTPTCEMCSDSQASPASVYCPADACYLCTACDHLVHTANRLARRHVRRPVLNDQFEPSTSIDGDSEIPLVPDVSPEQSSYPPTIASMSFIDEQWMTANGIKPSPSKQQQQQKNEMSVNFEEVMQDDLVTEFDLAPSKLHLNVHTLEEIDDQSHSQDWNHDSKLSNQFYSDVSQWDNMVSDEEFEHVVPDIETKVVSPVSSSHTAINSSTDTTLADELTFMINDHLDGLQKPIKKEEHVEEEALQVVPSSSTMTMEDNKLNNGKIEDQVEEESDEKTDDKETEEEAQAKELENRKKRRQEALARFRSKRANRSFTKKVRYQCRKQLADSRPRVKGRFVRKVEMALFRKYGPLYRQHLDELKTDNGKNLATAL